MTELNLTAVTVALGGAEGQSAEVPHGANTKMPAQVFVTAHGNEGDIVDAATGRVRPERLAVTADVGRRQVEIRVPYSAFEVPVDTTTVHEPGFSEQPPASIPPQPAGDGVGRQHRRLHFLQHHPEAGRPLRRRRLRLRILDLARRHLQLPPDVQQRDLGTC